MGLVTTDAEYQILTPNTVTHVPPVQPLSKTIMPPNGLTQAQITEAHQKHKIQTTELMLYKRTNDTLVRRKVYAANKELLLPMNHSLLGYAYLLPREIMQNFLDNYFKFDESTRKTRRI